jgi:hypothetical protein
MSEFVKDCYGLRANGVAMPAHYLGIEDGFLKLMAPNGVEYTFHPDNVLSVEEVEEHLKANRIAKVVASYRFDPIFSTRYASAVRCFLPGKPSSDYTLSFSHRVNASTESCSCPAFAKSGASCKHLEAYRIVLAQRVAGPAAPQPVTTSPPSWDAAQQGMTAEDHEYVRSLMTDQPDAPSFRPSFDERGAQVDSGW